MVIYVYVNTLPHAGEAENDLKKLDEEVLSSEVVQISKEEKKGTHLFLDASYGSLGPSSLAEMAMSEPAETKNENKKYYTDESLLLDAWHYSFTDPTTRYLLLKDKVLYANQKETMEMLKGEDDRKPITNTTEYPWRCICMLIGTTKTGVRYIGTGWFASPRVIMTAGHCIYIHDEGGFPQDVDIFPARNGSNLPYTCKATEFISVKGWTDNKLMSHDYGAIILPHNNNIGNKLGNMGCEVLSDSDLLNLPKVNIAGYPGDKPRGTLWNHALKIDSVSPQRLIYTIDTMGGQSGSAVTYLKGDKLYAIGIHTNGSEMSNSGTRITNDVVSNIKRWYDK